MSGWRDVALVLSLVGAATTVLAVCSRRRHADAVTDDASVGGTTGYQVVQIPGLLHRVPTQGVLPRSPAECEELVREANRRGLEPAEGCAQIKKKVGPRPHSAVVDGSSGGRREMFQAQTFPGGSTVDDVSRTSQQAWVRPDEHPVAARLRDLTESLTGMPPSHQEPLRPRSCRREGRAHRWRGTSPADTSATTSTPATTRPTCATS
jgi:hypothetical protein